MKIRILVLILGLASLLALPGCATGGYLVYPLLPLSAEAKAAQVAVYISPEEHHRENIAGIGESLHFRSGEVLAAVFNGTDPAGPRLEISNATSMLHFDDLGFTAVYTYQISAILHVRDQVYPFKAEGVERAHGMKFPTTYAQVACEKACVDLSNQIRPLLGAP